MMVIHFLLFLHFLFPRGPVGVSVNSDGNFFICEPGGGRLKCER